MSPTDRDNAILREAMREYALGEIPAKPLNPWQDTRVQTDDRARTVYSYGRHFPLAMVYPRGKRRGLILLNGDRWGGSRTRTPSHQTAVQEIAREICETAPGWQVLIVPLSAIDGAGIDGASIRPLDIRPDTFDRFAHRAIMPRDTFGSAPTRGTMPNSRAFDYRRNRIESEPLEIPQATSAVESRRIVLDCESSGAGIERAGIPANATRNVTVTRKTVWSSSRYAVNGYETIEHNPPRFEYGIVGAIGSSQTAQYPTGAGASLAPDGESIALDWSSSRHWLGDSLFIADRVSESSRPCHTANEQAPENAWCEQCGGSLARDGRERLEIRRRYRFLSSFDYNERAPLYFLAALPTKSRAQSIAMALDDLAPAAVHAALARGLAVERQGDIFFIPTALDDSAIEARGARRARLTMFTRGAKARRGEIGYRAPLNAAQRRAMHQWRINHWRELMRQAPANAAPVTEPGARKRYAALRTKHAETLAAHNANIRALIFGKVSSHTYGNPASMATARRRTAIAYSIGRARQSLDYCARLDGRDANGNRTAAQSRDRYRAHNANRARELWRTAEIAATLRFDPMAYWQSPQSAKAREDAREALAIYGTAHTATEIAVTASGTFARGTVRHVPAVANERRDADHAPLALDAGTWYLAVRNTVPRMVGTVAPRRRGW